MLDRLSNELRKDLMAGDIPVPPYPVIAARLSQLLATDNFHMRTLCDLVAKDEALAAAVVKRASSPIFSAGRQVNSIPDAVSRLGAKELMRVAVRVGLASAALGGGALAGTRRQIWRCGVLSAELGSFLARGRGIDQSTAFLGGLLHDFGKVICVSWLEQRSKQGEPPVPPPLREALIEQLHVEVGMVVAHRWNLSDEVAEVIARHHHTSGLSKLCSLVQTLDQVATLVETSPAIDEAALAQVPGLLGREATSLSRHLPLVVAQLSELESSAERGALTSAENAISTLGKRKRVVDFDVVCTLKKEVRGRATAMSYAGVRFHTKRALPEQQLIRLKVANERPFEVLVNIALCVDQGDHYLVEARPYGLDGAARESWSALWSDAQAVAA